MIALNEIGLIAVALIKREQFFITGSRLNGWARYLVAVQVQDREHRPVTSRIQEFDSLPTSLKRTRLSLAVSHNADDKQVGVVQCGAQGVQQRIAEFAPFVK
jgi:hypothetical protein